MITFAAPLAWVPSLVAGCAAEPSTVEDALAAADFYRPGIAADVIHRLIEADRVRLGRLSAKEGDSTVLEQRREESPRVSLTPATEGQLHIILPEHRLTAHGSVGRLVHQRGEIEVSDGQHGTGRYVTYQLSREWVITVAREASW